MQKRARETGSLLRSWGIQSTASSLLGIRVVVLTSTVKLLLPPLFFSSLPKRAIGFSFPTGRDGKLLGGALAAATLAVSLLLMRTAGVAGLLLVTWFTGGTAALIIYNSTRERVAFVKEYCQSCRLRPIIEEHEAMHLDGEPSEEVIWAETRRRYSYEGLGLAHDPKICSFCPIAKKLRDH